MRDFFSLNSLTRLAILLSKIALFILGLLSLILISSLTFQDNFSLSFNKEQILDSQSSIQKSGVSIYNALQPFVLKYNPIDREGPSVLLENGGIVGAKDKLAAMLCSLNIDNYCFTGHIAESIDLLISFNPIYYIYQGMDEVRFQTHLYFISYLKAIGIRTQVVEAIVPQRGQQFVATQPDNEPWETRIFVETPMYYRENLVNVGARKVWDQWEYLLMIDGHHYFENTYWWEETIWKLEHFRGVQLYRNGTHLDTKNDTDPGFELYTIAAIRAFRKDVIGIPRYTGNAWAVKKEDYEKIGYIVDYCVAAGCDGTYYMGCLKDKDIEVELLEPSLLNAKNYYYQLNDWIWNASKVFDGELTYIRGKIVHFWHEAFFSYEAVVRDISTKVSFDYKRDLRRDENYTLHLSNDEIVKMFDQSYYGSRDAYFPSLGILVLKTFVKLYIHVLRWISKTFEIYIYLY